ncbi:MAG: adenylosuccinate synthase [Deltaproteobacteria bacterium]|nr:adenylosuccinate synthase [Deltaproteobacteria bacterium]
MNTQPVTVVIGLQWGDEGKGKIVDSLARDYDFVVRFNGGPNAGHTLINKDRKLVLHTIPSGVFHRRTKLVITPGVVIDPVKFKLELRQIKEFEIQLKSRLVISPKCNLILECHKELDRYLEELRGKSKIGTTLSGIGPVYADKARYLGVRIEDVFNKSALQEKLRLLKKYHRFETWNLKRQIGELESFLDEIQGYLKPTEIILNSAVANNKSVLFEGAQGTLLDNTFGTYPYCTASSCLSASACLNTGVPLTKINRILGVFKAYVTRVGAGPFPSEIREAGLNESIREIGKEYGATTGRPRRIGWLDIPALKYSCSLNGCTELALTKIDVLYQLNSYYVVTRYKLNGEVTDFASLRTEDLYRVEPELKLFRVKKSTDSLYQLALDLKNFIEDQLNLPIKLISYGPKDNEIFTF